MAIAAHDFVNTSPTNVFATLNSIFSSSGTYTNGNLYINADDSDYHFSTISVPVGKIIYFEIIPISTTNREIVGFKTVGNNYTNGDYDIYYYNWENDDTRRISENGSYISSHLNNDITDKIVGLALDLTGTYINLKMYVNGSLLVNQNTTTTVNSRNNIFPYVRSASGAFTFYLNFGQDSSLAEIKLADQLTHKTLTVSVIFTILHQLTHWHYAQQTYPTPASTQHWMSYRRIILKR